MEVLINVTKGLINMANEEETAVAQLSLEERKNEEAEVGEEKEEGEENDIKETEGGEETAAKKKKKKRKKKKKKKKASGEGGVATSGNTVPSKRPHGRGLGKESFTDSYLLSGQTDPPTIPIADLYPTNEFPVGEIVPHPLPEINSYRETDAEKRARDRLQSDIYEKARHASEVHRTVRKYAQSFIKPGIKLTDMCERLENKNRELVKEDGLTRGIGFPTGCSINHVAAHYTPNPGDDTVLQYDDVMKIDFGTQIDGRIIDSAW